MIQFSVRNDNIIGGGEGRKTWKIDQNWSNIPNELVE